jgi:Flp pilus assembly protein TadD
VLAQEKSNAKALFRRGRAHAGLGRTEEALSDLQEAARLAPEDRAVAREIAAVRAAQRRERQAQVFLFHLLLGWMMMMPCSRSF